MPLAGRGKQVARGPAELLKHAKGWDSTPKKFGRADWHQQGRSLERKKRIDSKRTSPVR